MEARLAVRELHRAGLLDPSRKIASGDEVIIPVRADPGLDAWAARLGARLVDNPPLAPREDRLTPRAQVQARLRGRLPHELVALVPDKWEQHGDLLVLRLPDALVPHGRLVGEAFAQALRLKTVLHDPVGVAGELREMQATFLHGDDPVATHVEAGIRYRFDASRVMFSSGNFAERTRAARLPARGETVADMFAGIGYFTLPLAVHAGPARLVAMEKNPVSFRYLQENVALNGVEHLVECWRGDNRDYPAGGFAHRVLMGYFPGTSAFLPTAFRLLRPEGGVIHYHDTAHERTWRDEMTRHVLEAARARGTVVRIAGARVVKSHSPGVVHAVLDVHVRRGGDGPPQSHKEDAAPGASP